MGIYCHNVICGFNDSSTDLLLENVNDSTKPQGFNLFFNLEFSSLQQSEERPRNDLFITTTKCKLFSSVAIWNRTFKEETTESSIMSLSKGSYIDPLALHTVQDSFVVTQDESSKHRYLNENDETNEFSELGLDNFFNNVCSTGREVVQELEKYYEKLNKLLKRLQVLASLILIH
ncbi:Uncharacterized protein Fot_56776 [Forsythia ovata]|uniref:Uncharacterized protein n=1 Tax=Forsythia ovata TaxID=205694 RepID=A0ABD1P1E9_9LAMI